MTLKSEEEIEAFLDNERFWQGDYHTSFFKGHLDLVPRIDDHYEKLKIKTRVICFLWDKKEYKEEYNNLKQDAMYLATRDNLRIGFVDN